jgi:hypothetical protein
MHIKAKLLFVFLLCLIGNLNALDNGNETFMVRLFNNVHKELFQAISLMQEAMAEVKEHEIAYIYSKTETGFGHSTITHYYDGQGNVFTVLAKYEEALDNLDTCNIQLAMGDGAALGVLMSVIGNMCKWDAKQAGISLCISSVILTIAKNSCLDKVAYLDTPKLVHHDNYFGILTNAKTFFSILGASSATYFGIDFIKKSIFDRICAVKEAV